jgi:hypothetical protein
MTTIDMLKTFTGKVEDYNMLYECHQNEIITALKCKVLSTPAHKRKKEFGEDVLKMTGLLHTCQERRALKN